MREPELVDPLPFPKSPVFIGRRPWRRTVTLEHGYLVTPPGQEESRAEPEHTAPDNGDVGHGGGL
jgi:hypothetical protein